MLTATSDTRQSNEVRQELLNLKHSCTKNKSDVSSTNCLGKIWFRSNLTAHGDLVQNTKMAICRARWIYDSNLYLGLAKCQMGKFEIYCTTIKHFSQQVECLKFNLFSIATKSHESSANTKQEKLSNPTTATPPAYLLHNLKLNTMA